MKYDFDKPTDRRGTGSYKWQVAAGELPMWVADMDFETAPAVKAAIIKRAEHGIFGYSVTPREFFISIADFFEYRHGYRPNPDDMVFSTGVVATVSSSVRKLTTPAENVLIMPPVYNIFYNCILNNGRVPLECELKYDDGRYSIDFTDLEEKLSLPQTSLMILCNPHNPVGKIWSRAELERIGELCYRYGVTVISDEIHCSITDPGQPSYIPFASVNETCRDISVSCVSATKAFNLAGLQCSAAIVPNPKLRHKVWRAVNTDECGEPGAFAIPASVAAFKEGGEWLDELLEYLFENRRIAENYIAGNILGIKAVHADATYLLWINISDITENSEVFAKRVRELTGLYLSDGVEYGSGGEGFVRMNLATCRANLLDGLERLKIAVERLSG